jgi:hypothetical protein
VAATSKLVWPKPIPDGCPEPPHTGRPGWYIRLVSDRNNPTDDDLRTKAELEGFEKKSTRRARCDRCALSIFDGVEAAQDFLDYTPTFPKREMAWMEAAGDDHGVIHEASATHRGHYHWWLPAHLAAATFRQFVRRREDGP